MRDGGDCRGGADWVVVVVEERDEVERVGEIDAERP